MEADEFLDYLRSNQAELVKLGAIALDDTQDKRRRLVVSAARWLGGPLAEALADRLLSPNQNDRVLAAGLRELEAAEREASSATAIAAAVIEEYEKRQDDYFLQTIRAIRQVGEAVSSAERTLHTELRRFDPGPADRLDADLGEELREYLSRVARSMSELPRHFPARLRREIDAFLAQLESARAGSVDYPGFPGVEARVGVVQRQDEIDGTARLEAASESFRSLFANTGPRALAQREKPTRTANQKARRVLDFSAAKREFPRMILKGNPGFGKTWCLRCEAFELAVEQLVLLRQGGIQVTEVSLPFFIRLPVLQKKLDAHGGPIESILDQVCAELAGGQISEAFKRFCRDQIRRGKALCLLDGWDEVSVRDEAFAFELTSFVERNPTSRVILASRILGYGAGPAFSRRSTDPRRRSETGFVELELLPLENAAMLKLIDAWFPEKHSSERFVRQIWARTDNDLLARVPLFLALLCRVAETSSGELPRTRSRLFERCLELFLGEWARMRRPEIDVSPARLPRLLSTLPKIGLTLLAENDAPALGTFSQTELYEHVSRALRGIGGESPAQWIAELCSDGILVSIEEEHYQFLHRGFHEFLAAKELAKRANAPGEGFLAISKEVDRRAWDPAWEWVLIMLAEQMTDPRPLLALLRDSTKDDLFRHRLALAVVCAAENQERTNLAPLQEEIESDFFASFGRVGHFGPLVSVLPWFARLNPPVEEGRLLDRMVLHLSSADEEVRRDAFETLTRMGEGAAAAAPSLSSALMQSNHPARAEIAELLLALDPQALAGPPDLPDYLIARYLDGWKRLKDVIRALPSIQPSIVVRIVEEAVHSEDYLRSHSCSDLADLLTQLNWSAAARDALAQRLVAELDSPSWRVRERAVTLLKGLGPAARPALSRIATWLTPTQVHTEDPISNFVEEPLNRKSALIDAMLLIAASLWPYAADLAPFLVDMLADGDWEVGRFAVIALEKFPLSDPTTKQRLLAMLTSDRKDVVENAGRAAARCPEAVPVLVGRLRDPQAEVRAAAARALADFGALGREAVPALIGALGDTSRYVCERAVEALNKLGGAVSEELGEFFQKVGASSAGEVPGHAFFESEPARNSPFGQLFDCCPRKLKAAAALAAVRAGGPGVWLEGVDLEGPFADPPALKSLVDELVRYLGPEHEETRRYDAARALGSLRWIPPEKLPPLADWARQSAHREPNMAWVLVAGGEAAVPVVSSLLADPDPGLRLVGIAAATALARKHSSLVSRLVDLLDDGVPEVSEQALSAISSLGEAALSAAPAVLRLAWLGSAHQRWLAELYIGELLAADVRLFADGPHGYVVRSLPDLVRQ